MEFKFTLTKAEMIAALKLHGLGSKKIRIVLVLFGVLLALIAVFTSHKAYSVALLIGSTIGYFCAYFFIIPFQAKKQYRELKTIQSEIRMEINNKGLVCESITGNNSLDWSHFKQWKHNKNVILLYITSKMFYILPRRVFEDESQFESILGLLDKNITQS